MVKFQDLSLGQNSAKVDDEFRNKATDNFSDSPSEADNELNFVVNSVVSNRYDGAA